jgi:hypothetical protein
LLHGKKESSRVNNRKRNHHKDRILDL